MDEISEQEDCLLAEFQAEAKKLLGVCGVWGTKLKARIAEREISRDEWIALVARFKDWYAQCGAAPPPEIEAQLARVEALDDLGAKRDAWAAKAKACLAEGAPVEGSQLIAESIELVREVDLFLPDNHPPPVLVALTLRVEELFAGATKRFRVPSLEGCVGAALLLEGTRNQSTLGSDWHFERHKPKAKRAAQLFLAHTAPLRKSLAFCSTLLTPGEPGAAVVRRAHVLMETAFQAVEAAMPLMSGRAPPELDPIRVLARIAQRGWADANDGDAPRGANPDDPLVKFVTAALAEIGINYPRTTVSAVLRGRRRTKRKDISGH